MAIVSYAAFSRAWSMAAVNVKVTESHQQSKRCGEEKNNSYTECFHLSECFHVWIVIVIA